MTGLGADLRHAIRLYAATPLSTALAVGALAVALAFVTVFASMWNDLALKPHPGFAKGGEIVSVLMDSGQGTGRISEDMAIELNDRAVTLEGVAGVRFTSRTVEFDGQTEWANIEFITRAYFPLLQPHMHLGRPFAAADHAEDAEPVAVLSYDFWQQHFGGSRDVLGKTLLIRGATYILIGQDGNQDASSENDRILRIVGVMARAMSGSFGGSPTDLWLAAEPDSARVQSGNHVMVIPDATGLARLRPGLDHRAATEELNARFSDLSPGVPGTAAQTRWIVHPRITMDANADRQTLRQVHLFLAASLVVALIASVNLGLFMLARAPGRRREMNIRFALGASRRRIVRQLNTESGLLVVVAALLGLIASLWLSSALLNMAFLEGAKWRNVNPMDWRVLALVSTAAALLTMVAALAPAAGLRRSSIALALRPISARAGPAQRASGIAQIALAGLLGGSALGFGWHLLQMSRAYFGFDAAHIVAVTSRIAPERIAGGSWQHTLIRRAHLRETLLRLPGIEAVAFGVPTPAVPGFRMSATARHPDKADHVIRYQHVSIDPDYPDLLGMRLLAGALPHSDDPPGVLVNEAFARAMWGTIDVIGNSVPVGGPMPAGGQDELRIVGVLADTAFAHPHEAVEPTLFNTAPFFAGMDSILLRTQRAPAGIRSSLQALIDDGAIEFEIDKVVRLRDAWDELLGADRARARLSMAAALAAIVLAACGFYGTQRYLVTAGRREYAIHAALGAGPKALRYMVCKRALTLGLPGLVLGTLLAFIATAWLRDRFIDPSIQPWVVGLLVATGTAVLILAAGLGPARQTRRMAPAAVLRED